MEADFRNTLIFISAAVIAVIFIHGFITIRRNKNPYKLKTSDEKIEPVDRGFDGSGFDQDGVSKPRVVGDSSFSETGENYVKPPQQKSFINLKKQQTESTKTAGSSDKRSLPDNPLTTKNSQSTQSNKLHVTKNESSQDVDIKENSKLGANSELTASSEGANSNATINNSSEHLSPHTDADEGFDYNASQSDSNQSTNEKNTETDNLGLFDSAPVLEEVKTAVADKPLYDTPITQPKPQTIKATTKPKPKRKSPVKKRESIKRNQIELNFDDPVNANDMPAMSALDEATAEAKEQRLPPLEPEVLAVSLVMPEGDFISGAALLPSLLTLGLKFGDMDIFHRHQDNAGNGKVTFSLANVMKPGTFDVDEMENFTTCGITLFMTLPNAGDAFEVFEHMLGAAKQISTEFGAQLLDDKRSVMTKQTEQHYKSKIREFERRNRIALNEIKSSYS